MLNHVMKPLRTPTSQLPSLDSTFAVMPTDNNFTVGEGGSMDCIARYLPLRDWASAGEATLRIHGHIC